MTRGMFKSIGEHALVLQNNLHCQLCLQSPWYNLPVLKLAPVSPISCFRHERQTVAPHYGTWVIEAM